MGQPIVISMSDILLLAGAIVTISAAVKVVCEAIHHFREPEETQDERIGTPEERVAVLEEVLQEQVMTVREEEKVGD